MPIYETFAKRKRNAEMADQPVIFVQDDLPKTFRVQIVHILNNTIGDPGHHPYQIFENSVREDIWRAIHDTLAKEMGVFRLWAGAQSHVSACLKFLLNAKDVDEVLSLIEIAFVAIQQNGALGEWSSQSSEDAVEELNHRFREHRIGYAFQGGQIISVESLYLHTETVEPAISLLYETQFVGALQEFMSAHGHFREGNSKDAIVAAENAFESTMKTICDLRGWDYSRRPATASNLLRVLFDNHLIPTELQSHFTALRSTLECGVPTIRNQEGQGGHGQGSDVVVVPDHLASYCLHLTATNIVFLIEAHKSMP